MLHWTAGQISMLAPGKHSTQTLSIPSYTLQGCATRCWENTKYVSKCLDDNLCLCNEDNYQNASSRTAYDKLLIVALANTKQAVFQCIYSQCDTVHFGSALHFTISQCTGLGNQIVPEMPPIPNHDLLRRQEVQYLAGGDIDGSGSAMGLPTLSMGFPYESTTYATQSAGGPYSPDPPSPTAPHFPLQTTPPPAPTGPLMFTGLAPGRMSNPGFYVLLSVISLYLAL